MIINIKCIDIKNYIKLEKEFTLKLIVISSLCNKCSCPPPILSFFFTEEKPPSIEKLGLLLFPDTGEPPPLLRTIFLSLSCCVPLSSVIWPVIVCLFDRQHWFSVKPFWVFVGSGVLRFL